MMNDQNGTRTADANEQLEKEMAELLLQVTKQMTALMIVLSSKARSKESGKKEEHKPLQNENPNEVDPLHIVREGQTDEQRFGKGKVDTLETLKASITELSNKIGEITGGSQEQNGTGSSQEGGENSQLLNAITELSNEVKSLKEQISNPPLPIMLGKETDTRQETQEVPILTALEANVIEPAMKDQVDTKDLEKLRGISSIGSQVKRVFMNIATKISDGVTHLTGGGDSLASDLQKQTTMLDFVNRLIDSFGQQQSDGSEKFVGKQYEFTRDRKGNVDISDAKGNRGVIFRSMNGQIKDNLKPSDISNFVEASKVVKQEENKRQQTGLEVA